MPGSLHTKKRCLVPTGKLMFETDPSYNHINVAFIAAWWHWPAMSHFDKLVNFLHKTPAVSGPCSWTATQLSLVGPGRMYIYQAVRKLLLAFGRIKVPPQCEKESFHCEAEENNVRNCKKNIVLHEST